MRLIALEACGGIAALLSLIMIGAVARHRAQRRSEERQHITAWSDYGWAVLPWVMIVGAALPAVKVIMAGD